MGHKSEDNLNINMTPGIVRLTKLQDLHVLTHLVEISAYVLGSVQ